MSGAIETVALPQLGFGAAWRAAARRLVTHGVPPERVHWTSEGDAPALPLFAAGTMAEAPDAAQIRLPRALLTMIEAVLCAAVPERFDLPYRAVWRAQRERHLLSDESDTDMARLRVLAKLVKRDAHKMKAFVRFCEEDAAAPADHRRRFSSWFEPDHYIVEATAPFFARRFGDMDWHIATPHGCATCASGTLSFAPGVAKPAALTDPTEELWRTYYTNIFNPARLKVKAMQSEMPKKYWKNLPEAALIPALVASAEERVIAMREQAASQPVPRSLRMAPYERVIAERTAMAPDRAALNDQIGTCTRCALHCTATQAVLGEGPDRAAIMVVGEQPGDHEDLAGRAFIGPAGRELNAAFARADLPRDGVYLTNAVKHFKHQVRGKRRLHERPARPEIESCRWWLQQEVALVQPALVIALGATASLALTGNGAAVTARQGQIEPSLFGPPVLITGHPAAILRAPDPARSTVLRDQLAAALKTARRFG